MAVDQVRNDVGTSSRATGLPAATSAHAAARSSVTMRQDTPSTTRWCTTSRSCPLPSGASYQTARTIRPFSGSSSAAAALVAAATSVAVRTPSRTVNTEPAGTGAGGTESVQPSPPTSRRARSMSWVSSIAWMTSSIWLPVIPAGVVNTVDW